MRITGLGMIFGLMIVTGFTSTGMGSGCRRAFGTSRTVVSPGLPLFAFDDTGTVSQIADAGAVKYLSPFGAPSFAFSD